MNTNQMKKLKELNNAIQTERLKGLTGRLEDLIRQRNLLLKKSKLLHLQKIQNNFFV